MRIDDFWNIIYYEGQLCPLKTSLGSSGEGSECGECNPLDHIPQNMTSNSLFNFLAWHYSNTLMSFTNFLPQIWMESNLDLMNSSFDLFRIYLRALYWNCLQLYSFSLFTDFYVSLKFLIIWMWWCQSAPVVRSARSVPSAVSTLKIVCLYMMCSILCNPVRSHSTADSFVPLKQKMHLLDGRMQFYKVILPS